MYDTIVILLTVVSTIVSRVLYEEMLLPLRAVKTVVDETISQF